MSAENVPSWTISEKDVSEKFVLTNKTI